MHNIIFPEVWVTTVTNRGLSYLPNIANNFKRQIYPRKKLCIIINSETEKKDVIDFLEKQDVTENLVVVSMPNSTLGKCLNRSIELMFEEKTYWIWAKMDDDDFYGPNYLASNILDMMNKQADIVGRRDMYIYIPEMSSLMFLKNGGHNDWTNWVQGASLTVKKYVLAKVRFPERNKGEDTGFLNNAAKKGFRIYASNTSDYVVIRHIDNKHHTWKMNIKKWLRNCIPLSKERSREFEEENHLYYSDNILTIKPYISGKIE